jgi:GNAT superfamily N-acetyltransferase
MIPVDGRLRNLGESDVPEIVDVLCESFFNYPVMRFVLWRERKAYGEKLKILMNFFVMARILREEILLGIGDQDNLEGVALVSRPDKTVHSANLDDLREQLWSELGTSARTRYESFGAACAQFQVAVPHLHLNMIGVRRREQGKGLGGLLIEHVHALSKNDPDSEGVTLNTEDAGNISLYEHLGYTLLGHVEVAPPLETWGFFRPDR